MDKTLCSVGLDVGTTTTQLIVSRLRVENRASAFAVPELEISGRQVVFRGPVHLTPLRNDSHVDGAALRQLVEADYRAAGITRADVDTGAVIVTGETSRKENAAAVLQALSDLAGEFVVATAGPDLESVLAANGAGAAAYSEKTGRRVLHMDIGGGTSNLALIEDGQIVQTGCLNVGGRLLKFDAWGRVYYVSPVLETLCSIRPGDMPTEAAVEDLGRLLTQALEMAAGLREETPLLARLTTRENQQPWRIPRDAVISFSGGVADCIGKEHPSLAFGDMGPVLGRCIRQSRLCAGEYRLGTETIRATVIGAGCHSARLSGSTVFYRDLALPVKNLPVAVFSAEEQESDRLPALIARRMAEADSRRVVLALPGWRAPAYAQLQLLARRIAEGVSGAEVLVCLEADMAKALGHCLCLQLPPGTPCLCIDRVRLRRGSFLDVGVPVGPALPVVVKTLILSHGEGTL